jgi:hypothetical protein
MEERDYSFSEWVLFHSEAVLSIPRAKVLACTDLNICDKLYPLLEWLSRENEFDADKYLVPDFVYVNGVKVQRPKGIGLSSWGQKLVLEESLKVVKLGGGDEVDAFVSVLAIYLQPEYDRITKPTKEDKAVFNADSAKELEEHILNMPLSEAWPLASFFLSSYAKLLREKTQHSNIRQTQTSYQQELTSLKNSVYGQRLSAWRRLLAWGLTKFWNMSTRSSSVRLHLTPKRPVTKNGLVR